MPKKPDDFPTEDCSQRFTVDQLLREHGFAIHDRPRHRAPSWIKNGTVFSQHRALAQLPQAVLEKAGIFPDVEAC